MFTPLRNHMLGVSHKANPRVLSSTDKADLNDFVAWVEKDFGIPCLHHFLTAVLINEIEPITGTYAQSDEAGETDAFYSTILTIDIDIRFSYAELTAKLPTSCV
jgi:hypothetical protein